MLKSNTIYVMLCIKQRNQQDFHTIKNIDSRVNGPKKHQSTKHAYNCQLIFIQITIIAHVWKEKRKTAKTE